MSFRAETWEGEVVPSRSMARPDGIEVCTQRQRYEFGRVIEKRDIRPHAPDMGGWLPDVFLDALTAGMRGLFGGES